MGSSHQTWSFKMYSCEIQIKLKLKSFKQNWNKVYFLPSPSPYEFTSVVKCCVTLCPRAIIYFVSQVVQLWPVNFHVVKYIKPFTRTRAFQFSPTLDVIVMPLTPNKDVGVNKKGHFEKNACRWVISSVNSEVYLSALYSWEYKMYTGWKLFNIHYSK